MAAISAAEVKLLRSGQIAVLKHSLILRNRVSDLKAIEALLEESEACLGIQSGVGDLPDIINCMRFHSQNEKLSAELKASAALKEKLNLLCNRLAPQPRQLQRIMALGLKVPQENDWISCRSALWKEVFLALYSKSDQNPVTFMAFLDKMKELLGGNVVWLPKINGLLANRGMR